MMLPPRHALTVASVLLLLGSFMAAPGAAKTDSELLLAFKATFNNGAKILASWNASAPPCASVALNGTSLWEGVNCTSGAVTKL